MRSAAQPAQEAADRSAGGKRRVARRTRSSARPGTRFIKGLAAAFAAPASLSIITTTFPEGPARNRALSIYAACGASGFSIGLILGGLMTEVGVALDIPPAGPPGDRRLRGGPEGHPRRSANEAHATERRRGRRADLAGGALAAGLHGVEAPRFGWTSPRTVLSFFLVATLLGAFVLIERTVQHPLVRLGILRLADEEQGLASGLLQSSFQIGSAIVMAAVTAVITQASVIGDESARAVLASHYPGLGLVAGVAALGLVIVLSGATGPSGRDAAGGRCMQQCIVTGAFAGARTKPAAAPAACRRFRAARDRVAPSWERGRWVRVRGPGLRPSAS